MASSDAWYVGNPSNFFASVVIRANKASASQIWYRTYFLEFLATLGGLITSVLCISAIFMSGYQAFVQQMSMIKTLYFYTEKNQSCSKPSEQFSVKKTQATQKLF